MAQGVLALLDQRLVEFTSNLALMRQLVPVSSRGAEPARRHHQPRQDAGGDAGHVPAAGGGVGIAVRHPALPAHGAGTVRPGRRVPHRHRQPAADRRAVRRAPDAHDRPRRGHDASMVRPLHGDLPDPDLREDAEPERLRAAGAAGAGPAVQARGARGGDESRPRGARCAVSCALLAAAPPAAQAPAAQRGRGAAPDDRPRDSRPWPASRHDRTATPWSTGGRCSATAAARAIRSRA